MVNHAKAHAWSNTQHQRKLPCSWLLLASVGQCPPLVKHQALAANLLFVTQARLQDSPFVRERLATAATATAKQQAAAGSSTAHANDNIKKRLFFSKTTSSGTAAAAAAAGGDGCDAATGRMADQDSAVLATPVLTRSSGKQTQQVRQEESCTCICVQ